MNLTLCLASEGGVALPKPRSKEDGHCCSGITCTTLLLLKHVRPALLPLQTSAFPHYLQGSLLCPPHNFVQTSFQMFPDHPLNTFDTSLVETVRHTHLSLFSMSLTNDHHMFLLLGKKLLIYFVCMDGGIPQCMSRSQKANLGSWFSPSI